MRRRSRFNLAAWTLALILFLSFTAQAAAEVIWEPVDFEGTIYVDMNIDGENLNNRIMQHNTGIEPSWLKYGFPVGWTVYDNPAFMAPKSSFAKSTVDQYSYRVVTVFTDAPDIEWPSPYGAVGRPVFFAPLLKAQTNYLDLQQAMGRLAGKLILSGALNVQDLSTYIVQLSGFKEIYDPATHTLIPQSTPYTRVYGTYHTDDPKNYFLPFNHYNPDGTLNFYLPEGPWKSPSLLGTVGNEDKGYYSFSRFNIVDAKDSGPNDHASYLTYSFGQPLNIIAGQTLQYNKEYCMGKTVFRFKMNNGGLLRNPTIKAEGTLLADDNKIRMTNSVDAYSTPNAFIAEPEVELYGPTMDLTTTLLQVRTADNTLMTIPQRNFSIKCNADQEIDIYGPTLDVTTPEPNLLSSGSSVVVAGTATDGDGVVSITVNGISVNFVSTGNPDDPNEVEFSYTLPVVPGTNTITVIAYDADNYQATDQRNIYSDQWIPTAMIVNPTGDAGYAPGTEVPVSVATSDRGYGFTMNVYLDGVLLYTEHYTPVDDQSWDSMSYSTSVTATTEDQVVTVEAIDDAGNSASASVLIKGSIEVPVGLCSDSINANSKGVIPVKIVGSADIDAASIDWTTVTLMGVYAGHGALEDNDCGGNADGYMDLVLHFDTQAVVAAIEAALGRELIDGETVTVTLEGGMFDGTRINGEDTVTISKKRNNK